MVSMSSREDSILIKEDFRWWLARNEAFSGKCYWRNYKNRYFFEDIQFLVQCPQEERGDSILINDAG